MRKDRIILVRSAAGLAASLLAVSVSAQPPALVSLPSNALSLFPTHEAKV